MKAKEDTLQRTLYQFDDTGTLIQEITDDGIGAEPNDLNRVTQRTIKKITPKTEAPCLGLPHIIENQFFNTETGEISLLNKTVHHYTNEGWLSELDFYDANHTLQYTIKKNYDRFGNPISQTDPIGNETIRQFDPNKNITFEQGPKKDHQIHYTYDLCNRLKSKTIVSTTGKIHQEEYIYDHVDNPIWHIDTFGNKTHYEYNDLRQCIRKTHPEFYDHKGNQITPKEKFSYDVFGNTTSYQDPNGNTKKVTYNIFNLPLLEEFPDSTKVQYEYEIDGVLKKEITKTGAYILYEHDALKRVLSKKTYSPSHELLTSESYTYNAFQMTSKIDANGNTTYFEYDHVGRPIREHSELKEITYEYDPLGRPHITKEKTGPNQWRITRKTHDLLNRVTDETIEDEQGTILRRASWAYDEVGNVLEDWQYTHQGPAITHFTYDHFNRVTKKQTPLGEEYHIEYQDEFVNPYDQRVLRKIETDPLGQQTITIFDTHTRPSIIQKKDAKEKLLHQTEIFYDPAGNKTKTIETLIHQGQEEKKITTAWYYNQVNQVIRFVEAEGTPDERTTQYQYNAYGQREQIIKPDRTILYYQYDPLGRLSSLHSSDQTIDEEYHYDPNGNLIQCIDNIQNTTTTRVYNSQNQVIEEILGNHLTISYKRDASGRPIEVVLPQGSVIQYQYDPLYLRSVSFNNYTHTYEQYDLTGKPLSQKLIGNTGTINHTYNLSMRPTNILSDHWKEENITYDPVGNLTSYIISDSAGKYTNTYTYDPLYQLTSEQGNEPHSYDFDSLFNRRHKDQNPYNHNSLNQLLSQGNVSYTYNTNGNLISKKADHQETTYLYDALDRLTTIIENNTKITFVYDCFHRRIRRIKETISNQLISDDSFAYQGKAEIGIYRNGKFHQLRILGSGIQGDIAASVLIQVNDKTYAPIHDHNGNICALISTSWWSRISQSYRYTAFGEESFFSSQGYPLSEATSPWRFSSKRVEGNLVHFGHRDYDPQIGRWITPDPIGFADGPNLYAYVHNNPLTHIDPDGLHRIDRNRPPLVDNPKPLPNKDRYRWRPQTDPKIVTDKHFYHNHFNNGKVGVFTVGDKILPHDKIFLTLGINTSYQQAWKTAKMFSEMGDGVHITCIYNPDRGFLNNITRCFLALFGYRETPVSARFREEVDAYLKDDPKGRAHAISHSEGTTNARNMQIGYDHQNPERAMRVDHYLFAPSAYLNSKYCGAVRHFETSRDFITHIDHKGRRECLGTLTTIPCHKDAPFFDHGIQSPSFRHVQQETMDKIVIKPG